MVNSQAFAKRLQKIMAYYELSASSFADKVDVGRSSISHIVSGRNKPSLDFIMKILRAFPDIDLYWLMNGSGNFMRDQNAVSADNQKHQTTENTTPPPAAQEHQTQKNISASTAAPDSGERHIKKVIILYDDGSFESFENSLTR